jgi:DNA-directed RNA polymerase subunit RPC12/RpoP
VRKNFGPPMTLANMRENGVRAVIAACEACGHKADVNVDALPETTFVPEAGRRLRCSACGGKQINTRPAWHTARNAWGRAIS